MANWPQFDPEKISIALFNQLSTAQFTFALKDRRGRVPQNVPNGVQPYLGLVEIGMSQVESQAQGLEKWLLHFWVLVYLRADANPESIPATNINAALLAIVNAMRSSPPADRQTLGGIVDNAWITGDVLIDTGILDQQCMIRIPIAVDCGL